MNRRPGGVDAGGVCLPVLMLLHGGTVVDVDGERQADVAVGADGRILAVGPDLADDPAIAAAAGEVIDVSGLLVVPGGVDAHTHMHLPVGAVQVSDDFATGTAAAAVGGTTTVIDYVTAYRGGDPLAALATWRRWAEPAAVDVGLHMTFTEAVPEATVADCIERGVTSFKLYLAYPQLLQVDDDVVFDMLRACSRHGGLVTVHCENGGGHQAPRPPAGSAGRRRGRARRCTSCTCPPPRGWPRCVPRSSAGWRCTPRPAPSTCTSTPPSSNVRAARTSCARPRCATAGTGRSCGRAWRGAGSRRSQPITARSGPTIAVAASPPGPRGSPTSPRSP